MSDGKRSGGGGWRRARRLGLLVLLAFLLPALTGAATFLGRERSHWSTARRDSAGLAPDPATTPEAVIQVYAARAWGWRGAFGVHSWIAVKPSGAPAYTRYEVIGWRLYHGGSALVVGAGVPDAYWFGSEPEVLAQLRGAGVDEIIARVAVAARAYPYPDRYQAWPGPNSNTFTAHIGRAVPELRLDLPPTAVGKDYLGAGEIIAPSPSGTGYQLSLLGILGLMVAREEGIEVNLLGLTLGIDFAGPALKLPGLGRLGWS